MADPTDPTDPTDPRVRLARPGDMNAVVGLVHDLAEYEKLPQLCHLTADQLTAALFGAGSFGSAPALYGLVATESPEPDAAVVGYALYFLNFSTWEGVHGIYLEDLYVRPEHRGSGLGKAMLLRLAAIAAERGYARVEWSVLDWNAPSIAFYESLRAVPMTGWTVYRLAGTALLAAAGAAGSERVADKGEGTSPQPG